MRAAAAQAQQQGQQAGQTATGLMGQAQQTLGSFIPQLEATAKSGLTPYELNMMNVAGQQESGGALSGIQGQANLQAMRARNAGGSNLALDQAYREKAAQDTENMLNLQKFGLGRQTQAEQMLGGLYGTQLGGAMRGYGLQQEDLRNQIAANQTGWYQQLMQGLGTVGQMGAGAGSVMTGLYGSKGALGG